MDLRPTIPAHPIDLLYGATLPELQTYIAAGPAVAVDIEALKERLRTALPERFTRMCYAQRNHLFSGRQLHRMDDVVAPVEHITMDEFHRLTPSQMRDVGERHWWLYVVEGDDIVVLCFMVGHWLYTGMKARSLIFTVLDSFYPDKPAGEPPPMTDAQWEAFAAFQAHMGETYRSEHDFAEYKREFFPVADVQRLARSLGRTFTDGVSLWLARSIHDVARRDRPLDIVMFRMLPDLVPEELNDPGYGNEGLVVELFEMLPDGFYARLDPASGLGSQKAEEFVDFYRKVPLKGALFAFLDWSIRRQKRKHMTVDRERLVMNNLGATDYPFFRTMFFDPFNDQDSFGLTFIDSCRGELGLQFAPPKRYLERFDWGEFSERLKTNLASMVDDPRLETRDG